MPSMGEIVAHLGLNDSKFKAGVNNVGKWSKSKFAAIGTAAAGAFAATFTLGKFNEALQFTASIQELAEQTSLTTEEFQRLSYQLRQVGGNQQDVVRGVNTLDRMMAKAREGNEAAIKDFDRLGISIENVTDESRLDILKRMAVVFNNLDEQSRGGALDALRRLLGDDSARRFVAAFKEDFVGGLAAAKVISNDVIKSTKELTGALQDLNDTALKELAQILSDSKEDLKSMISLLGTATSATANIVRQIMILRDIPGAVFDEKGTGRMLELAAQPLKPVTQAGREMVRRQEIQDQFQAAQLEALKKIEQNTSANGISGSIMGG